MYAGGDEPHSTEQENSGTEINLTVAPPGVGSRCLQPMPTVSFQCVFSEGLVACLSALQKEQSHRPKPHFPNSGQQGFPRGLGLGGAVKVIKVGTNNREGDPP